MNGEPTLPFELPEPPADRAQEDLPLIYVASPLTRVADSPDKRRAITFQVDKIVSTIQERRDGQDGPRYRTHAPAVRTAPWAVDGPTDVEIYRSNTQLVIAEVDGLITLDLEGGSSGTGQELELASRRGIPVLRLSVAGERISRQIAGNPMVTAATYDLPDELAATVTRFLVNNATPIEDGPRTRRNLAILYSALQGDLLSAWNALNSRERGRVASEARVRPAYLDHHLSHPVMVATLPNHQLVQLGHALGVEAANYLTTQPVELTIRHLDALVSAQDQYRWSDEQTEWVRSAAQRELNAPGVRRLLLNSPADWRRLMETISRDTDR